MSGKNSDPVLSLELLTGSVRILDQTRLPAEEVYLEINHYQEMVQAIKRLSIRGAPAIGIAAAAAGWLAVRNLAGQPDFRTGLLHAFNEIEASRPTAVNLFKATRLLREKLELYSDVHELEKAFRVLTCDLIRRETDYCNAMGQAGADWLGGGIRRILTHCNTGSLATAGIGTALGVIRTLAERQPVEVFATETRPLLQGARLTMWELEKSGISSTLITDSMAAWTISQKKIDCVITGADRIARNGDTANKIGTYALALAAKHHKIPMVIVAPSTTIDPDLAGGTEIPIEERRSDEVLGFSGCTAAPVGSRVFNPAFDVTPATLISAIVTEHGVSVPPYRFPE